MIRLGVLFALLATFDIGEGVCLSCSDKCEGMDGQVAESRVNRDDPKRVDCMCKKDETPDFDSGCTGTMQSGGTEVEFCCSSCGKDEICTTSIGGGSPPNDDESKKCKTSDECPKDAGSECGYDCMDGNCAMWCNGGEQPLPVEDECKTPEDCNEAAGWPLADQYCGYDCSEGKCMMWCQGAPQPPPSTGCVTFKDCPGEEQCHCEPHGTVRRRLLFAGSKMQKCSCGV